MLIGCGCSLCVDCRELFVVRCVLFVLFVGCCLLLVVCLLLAWFVMFVVWLLLFVVRYKVCVACCLLRVVCGVWCVCCRVLIDGLLWVHVCCWFFVKCCFNCHLMFSVCCLLYGL